tara:strand:- start:138 stop:512 length:375 start_codon:yes stop_codon:yes gene_type:complete
MSTLKTGTVQNNTGTGAPLFKNNAGTEIGQLAKAWVLFNGKNTVAIRDDFNVESLTDNGTGDYTINFTTAMSSANYAVAGAIGDDGNATAVPENFATSSVGLQAKYGSSSFADYAYTSVIIFGA